MTFDFIYGLEFPAMNITGTYATVVPHIKIAPLCGVWGQNNFDIIFTSNLVKFKFLWSHTHYMCRIIEAYNPPHA